MKKHTHAFIRQDGLNIDAVAILEIWDKSSAPERSAKEALSAMESAISKWVAETETGKEAYEASSEDYNIGDFVDNYRDPELEDYLDKAGIEGVNVVALCPDATNTYDRHLVSLD